MKKDKEWFKGLINEEGIVVDMHLLGRHDEQYWKNENIKINKGRLFYLIDQLDEPETLSIDKEQLIKSIENYNTLYDETVGDVVEGILEIVKQLPEMRVLSQEWIYEHTWDNDHIWRPFVYVDDLQNLLVPKQEEVKIESVWAEDIKDAKASGMTLFEAMDWMAIDCDEKEKQDLFARAWLDGCTIEEQKYYVRDKHGVYLLAKNHQADGRVETVADIVEFYGVEEVELDYELTKQEIKDYDTRYWAFAVKVEELEE